MPSASLLRLPNTHDDRSAATELTGDSLLNQLQEPRPVLLSLIVPVRELQTGTAAASFPIVAMWTPPAACSLIPRQAISARRGHDKRDVGPVMNVHGCIKNLSPVPQPDRATDLTRQLPTRSLLRPKGRSSETTLQ